MSSTNGLSRERVLAVALVLGLASLAFPLVAQETGSISGTLLDADGVPLPGVAVTVDGSLIPATTKHSQANGVYRFPTIPPAQDYTLTFQLDGFQEVVYDGLIVQVGGNIQINVSMMPAGVSELVLVSGESPLIDVKKIGTGNNVTEQYMQSIPSARDPWAMLEHTSGVQVSKQNVGGSGSGTQSGFVANGTKFRDTVWTYDGADVSGLFGYSDMYYDFDAFEEISITTGGNDPSVQTGGIRINFVTRRGGNAWRGSTRFYVTDSALQSNTVTDPETGDPVGNYTEDELFPGYVGDSIDNIKDWGAEVGGPALRDRLFAWGAFGRQDIKTFVGTTPSNVQINNWHAKANWHVNDKAVANFTFVNSTKTEQGRGAGVRRPLATTQEQSLTTPVYTGKFQYAFNDNNYLEVTVSNIPELLVVEPSGGRDVQATYDLIRGIWGQTYFFFDLTDDSWNGRVDGNSYLAGVTDHEIKYGYSFRKRHVTLRDGMPQGAVAVFELRQPSEAWLIQDGVDNVEGAQHGLYLGDTVSTGRMTLNLGVRYDHQTSRSLPSAVPAHPTAPEVFPGNSFPGYDTGYAWNSLSPRLGITYDLSGDARTVLRLSAARYYSRMDASEFHRTNTTSRRELDFTWDDINGNGAVDLGETGDAIWISSGWDPSNPSAPSANVINETSPPWTNEVIAGVEREISRSFAIGANLIYRRHGNFTWAPRAGEDDPSFWRQVTQNIAGYGELTVYEPVGPRARYTIYKQRLNFRQPYAGMELFLNKRFSDGWMASASFNFGQLTNRYAGAGAFTDPTNIERLDDRPEAYGSRFGYWGASRWYFKSSAMYQLPAGFSVAGYFQVREGNVNPESVRSNRRANGAFNAIVLVEDFGETRLPTYWNLDLRAEKTFDLADRGRVHVIVDAFNVTNNDTILGRDNLLNSPTYGRINKLLQGRTIRFGLRLVLR